MTALCLLAFVGAPVPRLEAAWIVSRVLTVPSGLAGATPVLSGPWLLDVLDAMPGNRSVVADDLPKYPVLGREVAVLYCLVRARDGRDVRYFSTAGTVILKGTTVRTEPWDSARWGPLTVEWSRVEPTRDTYANIERESGSWWDQVDYQENLLPDAGPMLIADVRPSRGPMAEPPVGTMRYKVTAACAGVRASSPGAESARRGGLLPDVHRVSMRGNTGAILLDWAYSFCGLPFIWGSASVGGGDRLHQAEEYVGADCADMVVAAAHRAGVQLPYTSCTGLASYATRVASVDSAEQVGTPRAEYARTLYDRGGAPLAIGPGGVQIGDLLFWSRHVGILAHDRSDPAGPDSGRANGILDAFDVIVHANFGGIRELPLRDQPYGLRFAVRRLKGLPPQPDR